MEPEYWQRVKELFNAALQHRRNERLEFLSVACGNDEALRKEVESLLESHEREGDFIDSPAYEVSAEMLTDAPELAVGQSIDHYKILSPLGRGGMGEVYLAQDTRLGRKVALKFLPSDFTNDDERLRRFEQEARAASGLNHPNILTIHEVGEVNERRFMATEFIDGTTLRQHIETGPLKVDETLRVAEQIASALAAAHAEGIVHRDIKPENIMLRRDGIVKVLDFGLAKLSVQKAASLEDSTRAAVRTSAGMVMGTVTYMSPEQTRGLTVDARTDLWSLGAVIYEMLSGRAPFEGATTSDLIVSVLEREPLPLTDLSTQAPEVLEWIVQKALTKEREDRYQTAREILTDIRRARQRLDTAARMDSTPRQIRKATRDELELQEAQRRFQKYPRLGLFVSAMLVLMALLGFGVYKLITRKAIDTARQTTSSTPNATALLKATQLTTSSGLDLSPTFSPDRSSLAYSSDRAGGFEIYIKSLAPGGREIQLTSDGGQNLEPAWSPDGKMIAYHSWRRGGIWIVPALGGTCRQLSEFGSSPAWSHDSTWIAFQSEGMRDLGALSPVSQPPSTIWAIPSQGGVPRRITQVGNPTGGHGAPSWSPDSSRILFSTGVAIWTISTEGGDLKRVSPDMPMVFGGVYAHDGKNVYYSGQAPNFHFGLWEQPILANGEVIGAPMPIANTGSATAQFLAISADGKNLAYSAVLTTGHLWSIPVVQSSGVTAGPPMKITSGTNLRSASPAFSPDGQKIAFVIWRTGANGQIWVMDSDGQNATQLTTDSAIHTFPSWLPDGNEVAYSVGGVLRATSLKTGKDRVILDPPQSIYFAKLSPDGKWVAFNSTMGGPINTWMGSVGTEQLKQLTFDKEMAGFPCWSPDGKLLALYIKRGDDNHLAVMPSTGGEVTQLTFEHGLSWPRSWSPDGDKIVFAGQRNGLWNIYWVSRTTKEQKQLTHYSRLNEFVRAPAWSPIGNQIVYEHRETTGNIWQIELK